MHVRNLGVLVPCVALAFGGAGDGTQDRWILAKDDVEFARALSAGGFPDLAEHVLSTIASSKAAGSDDALMVRVLELDLAQDRAFKETDAVRRRAQLEKVVKDKEEFISAHTGSEAADDVQNGLVDLYRGVGELIVEELQKGTTPEVTTQLRQDGGKMFERAVRALDSRLTELLAKREAQDQESPDTQLEYQCLLTSYNLARTYYFHALLLEPGSLLKETALKSATQRLSDIQLDFPPDDLIWFECLIYNGLCEAEMGHPERAIAAYDAAIAVRETFEQRGNGVWVVPPEAADTISSAYLQKIIVLANKGDHPAAIAAAKEYFATTPNPEQAAKGLAILAKLADLYEKVGDGAGVEATAKRLVEVDPRGPGGERGREILGTVSTNIGSGDTMRMAEAAANKGDFERAADLCRDAMRRARGMPDEAAVRTEASLLLGAVLAQRSRVHEAVVVWEDAAERYKTGDKAAECIWRAVNGYLTLQGQESRAGLYRTRALELMSELGKSHADSPYATMVRMVEARMLAADKDWEKAAETFLKVAPGTAGYEEAIYRAGDAYSRYAQQLAAKGKTSEAVAAYAKAESTLRDAIAACAAAEKRTLETTAQDRLRAFSFNARISLAGIYLSDAVKKPEAVMPLFEGLDASLAKDSDKLGTVWMLRFKASRAMGKLDDAIALLDARIREDPKGKGLGAAAAVLARVLDERANEQIAKAPNAREAADVLLRKAADYYMLAVRGQLSGEEALKIEEAEPIANRLFALGLHFNRVPEDRNTFIEWNGARPAKDLWEAAASVYAALRPLTASYRIPLRLAQTYGFLGRYVDADAAYAELFERESLVDPVTKTFRADTLRAKPELLFAYIEWGWCEREAGVATKDMTRVERASSIFETLTLGTPPDSAMWWQAKYWQLVTLMDRGKYEVAEIALNSVERNSNDFDGGRFGYRDRFVAIRDELKRKLK